LTACAFSRLLPVAPRPQSDERLSSWLGRIAALYGLPVGALLAHCGLVGADPFVLERGLGAGEGALLAEPMGLGAPAIEAMTFHELRPSAMSLVARADRAICPLCAPTPAIRRKDAALPWGFWCAVHGSRRRPPGGEAIEILFGATALAILDPLAKAGARRLAEWATGRGDETPSVADLLAFATTPYRRPSPPKLHEQPRMSLAARRANRGYLAFPIARQALLVLVPEYDRVAPPLAKPVRCGVQGMADGSLLQNFALAVALARLSQAPVEGAAAALSAADDEGRERLRAALEPWPAELRRRIAARLRDLATAGAPVDAKTQRPVLARRFVSRSPAPVSTISVRAVSRTPVRSLTNCGPSARPER
jgi:hypothetical protein